MKKVTPPSRLSVVGRPAMAVLKAQTPISSTTAAAAKPPAARRLSLRRGRNGTATMTRLSRYCGRIATAAAPSAPPLRLVPEPERREEEREAGRFREEVAGVGDRERPDRDEERREGRGGGSQEHSGEAPGEERCRRGEHPPDRGRTPEPGVSTAEDGKRHREEQVHPLRLEGRVGVEPVPVCDLPRVEIGRASCRERV